VTDRLRCAVKRYADSDGGGIPNWDGKLGFTKMREKCREPGNEIQVGHEGGEAALLKSTLVDAEKKQWKWRDPETNKGTIIPGNWLRGADWLEIVESSRGFGSGGA
jgi:hypothetical protein